MIFKYRKVIFVVTLLPSMFLGFYLLRIMQLVRRGVSGYDQVCDLLFHKNGRKIMYYLIGIMYIILAIVVASYAIFGESEAPWVKRKYLIQALEYDENQIEEV